MFTLTDAEWAAIEAEVAAWDALEADLRSARRATDAARRVWADTFNAGIGGADLRAAWVALQACIDRESAAAAALRVEDVA